MNVEKLLNNLPKIPVLVWNRETREHEDKLVAPHAFIRDGYLYVSAENGDDAADYYGEYHGGYAWINPILEKFATDNKCYWEWQDAGTIVLNK
jgi:hypothetical protein